MAENEGWYRWQEATSRFDYLLVSAAGAICLFHAQTFGPAHRDPWLWALGLLPFALLLASAFWGLRRIEAMNVLIAVGHQRASKVGELQKIDAAMSRGIPGVSPAGEPIALPEERGRVQGKVEGLLADEERWGSSAERAYSWRNWLLYLGLLVLVIHRVVEAWLASSPQPR